MLRFLSITTQAIYSVHIGVAVTINHRKAYPMGEQTAVENSIDQ